jgi:hypothetical protein
MDSFQLSMFDMNDYIFFHYHIEAITFSVQMNNFRYVLLDYYLYD